MMKLKNISWLLLLILLPIAIINLKEIASLNIFSIQKSKSVLVGNQVSHSIQVDKQIKSNINLFHRKWLNQISNNYGSANGTQPNQLEELINYSPLYMHMIKNIFPTSRAFAELAITSYPDDTIPLYWLIDSMVDKTTVDKKRIYEKILSLNPKDGVAWRHLGLIYIAEKNIPAAIDAHIKSCYNGDPGSNGCYNAGRLLEQEGRYEEAISFYRLSRHDFIRANADRLEEFLAGSD